MFCGNCGHQTDGKSRYCANCGAVQNNIQQIQPVITNVNTDATLPKNHNFFITFLFVVCLMLVCACFLTVYKTKYDYKISVVNDGYRIYLPYGFGTKKEDTKDGKELVITSEDMNFIIYHTNDDYDKYKYNDFSNTKLRLTAQSKKAKSVKEETSNGHNIILAEYEMDKDSSTNAYMFIYDTGDSDLLFYGYIETADEISSSQIDTLVKVLSKMEKI